MENLFQVLATQNTLLALLFLINSHTIANTLKVENIIRDILSKLGFRLLDALSSNYNSNSWQNFTNDSKYSCQEKRNQYQIDVTMIQAEFGWNICANSWQIFSNIGTSGLFFLTVCLSQLLLEIIAIDSAVQWPRFFGNVQ